MIKVLKIVGADFTYKELMELAEKATADIPVKRIILPASDSRYLGKVVDVLLLCGRENPRILD